MQDKQLNKQWHKSRNCTVVSRTIDLLQAVCLIVNFQTDSLSKSGGIQLMLNVSPALMTVQFRGRGLAVSRKTIQRVSNYSLVI